MKLIGISGKKTSGKDEVFEIIQHLYIDSIRYRFGDALKTDLYKHVLKPNGVDQQALYDERKPQFRGLLQWWGDFRREVIDKDYWIKKLDTHVSTYKSFDGFLVISDVRYINEAEYIRNNGGTLIRVSRPRPGFAGWVKDKLNILEDKHISETELDDYKGFDFRINNDGTLLDLQEKMIPILNEINENN